MGQHLLRLLAGGSARAHAHWTKGDQARIGAARRPDGSRVTAHQFAA